MLTFLVILHTLGRATRSLALSLRPLYSIIKPRVKFGVAFTHNSLGIPEPKFSITLFITSHVCYKISISPRSLYTAWRWLSSWLRL